MSDIDALKPTLESIAKAVSDVSTSLKGGADSMASYKRAAADARVKIAELTASGKTMGAAFKDAEAQLKSNENAWKAHNQAMKATEEQFKKLEKECETVTDKYAKLNAAATAFYGKLSQGIAAVTGTTISFAKAKDSLLGFNNAMFGASRSYQMFGKDLGDVNKVFEGITKNTTYSKREFTELANTIISSWKGVPPSFTELGKILETVGKQFGHNKEQVKAYLSSLSEIQSVLPAAAKMIRDSLSAMSGDKSGWENQINGSKTLIMNLYAAGKISQSSMMAQLQAMTPVTAAQKKQNELTAAQGKAAAAMENAMVNAMQSIQEPMTKALNLITEMTNGLGKMPSLIMAVVAAMAMMKIPAGAMASFTSLFKGQSVGGGMINLGRSIMSKSGVALRMGAGAGVLGGVFGALDGHESKKRESLQAGESEETASGKGKMGAWAGGLGTGFGAAAGAALGSIVPGLGTMFGSVVGGYLGSKFLTPLLSKLFGADTKPKTEEETKQDQLKKDKEAMDKFDKDNPMAKQVVAIREMVTNNRYLIEANETLKAQYETEANILKDAGDLGGMNRALDKAMGQTKELQASSKALLTTLTSQGNLNFFDETLKSIDGNGMSEKVKSQFAKGDYKGAFAGLQKELIEATDTKKTKLIKAAENDPTKRKTLDSDLAGVDASRGAAQNLITEAMKAQNDLLKTQVDLAGLLQQKYMNTADMLSSLNDVYSKRLDLERSVQEAAQFGMGASISMMQKQVAMAYNYMGIEKDRMGVMDQQVGNMLVQNGLTKEQAEGTLDVLKNTSDSGRAMEIIKQASGGNEAVTKSLVNYSKDYQGSNSKILEQQKKIYELTKDIREGYLDAIREMTAGAGEFETIIGTQDMGVTQLMDKVDMFTPGALNTMKTGGRQSKEETAAGVGMGITASYGSGGMFLSNENASQTNAKNRRYWGWEDSKKQAEAMSRGEGRKSEVGSSAGIGEDGKYLRSYQEEKNIQVDAIITANRMMNGNRMQGLMTGSGGNGPNGGLGTFGNNEKINTSGFLALATSLAAGAKGQSPADPSGFVRGAMSGKMGGDSYNVSGINGGTAFNQKYGIPTILGNGTAETSGSNSQNKYVNSANPSVALSAIKALNSQSTEEPNGFAGVASGLGLATGVTAGGAYAGNKMMIARNLRLAEKHATNASLKSEIAAMKTAEQLGGEVPYSIALKQMVSEADAVKPAAQVARKTLNIGAKTGIKSIPGLAQLAMLAEPFISPLAGGIAGMTGSENAGHRMEGFKKGWSSGVEDTDLGTFSAGTGAASGAGNGNRGEAYQQEVSSSKHELSSAGLGSLVYGSDFKEQKEEGDYQDRVRWKLREARETQQKEWAKEKTYSPEEIKKITGGKDYTIENGEIKMQESMGTPEEMKAYHKTLQEQGIEKTAVASGGKSQAGQPAKPKRNILGQLNESEMGDFASGMSQGLGDMRQKKTESDEDFTKRRTKRLSQQYIGSKPWENFELQKGETQEAYEKRTDLEQKKMTQTQEAIKTAGGMRFDKQGLDKEKGKEVVMETMKTAAQGHFTSAAEKRGAMGPEADESARQYMDASGVGSGDGGGGGGAGGVITVTLSSELQGTINEMHGILLKINDAASVKG